MLFLRFHKEGMDLMKTNDQEQKQRVVKEAGALKEEIISAEEVLE